MPVLQVQGRVLRGGEQAELPGAPGLADLTGFQVLAAEQVVNQLQACPAERDGDADPQQLVRTGVQERVAWARPGHRRVDRGPAERLELPTALFPVHRHQGQDEVGLVELDSLGVDPHENLGDLFLVRRDTQLDDLEPEVPQIADAVDPFLQDVLLSVIKVAAARLGQTLQESTDRRLVPGRPQRGDIGDELRITDDRGVSDLEGLITGPEGDLDPALLKRLCQHLLAGDHRVQSCEPLLPVHYKQLRRPVTAVHPDTPRPDLGASLPEHQRPDRVPAVQGVEQVPRLGRRPHERALDIGQADPADPDVLHKVIQRVTRVPVQRWRHPRTPLPTAGPQRRPITCQIPRRPDSRQHQSWPLRRSRHICR